MPQNVTVAAFVFGAILILIAILRETFKLFGAEIPATTNKLVRIFAGVAGVILIYIGLTNPFGKPTSIPAPGNTSADSGSGGSSAQMATPEPTSQSIPSLPTNNQILAPTGRLDPTQPPVSPIPTPIQAQISVVPSKATEDELKSIIKGSYDVAFQALRELNTGPLFTLYQGDALQNYVSLINQAKEQAVRSDYHLESLDFKNISITSDGSRAEVEIETIISGFVYSDAHCAKFRTDPRASVILLRRDGVKWFIYGEKVGGNQSENNNATVC